MADCADVMLPLSLLLSTSPTAAYIMVGLLLGLNVTHCLGLCVEPLQDSVSDASAGSPKKFDDIRHPHPGPSANSRSSSRA